MKKNKSLLLILCGLVCLVQFDCKKITDGISIYINADYIKYSASLKVYDAGDNTGAQLTGVTVSISGQDASSVYEIAGSKTLTVVNGAVTVGIDPKHNPSVGTPVNFAATFSAPGYLPVVIPVTMVNGTFNQRISVPMIKISNPPAGVSVQKTSATLSGNATTTAQTITTPTSGTQTTQIALTVPANTQFKDVNGAVISGSSVNTTIVHFDNSTTASVQSFPGGLIAKKVVGQDGKTSSAYFTTAGFATIIMDVNGKDVRSFSQSLSAKIDVDPTTVNPTTKQAVKAGDKIPVYSYENDDQTWKYEQEVTIAVENGKLVANIAVPHLSTYEIGYTGTTCTNGGASVTFHMDDPTWSDNYVILVGGVNATGPFLTAVTVNAKDGDVVNIPDVPAIGALLVTHWSGGNIATDPGVHTNFDANVADALYSATVGDLCKNMSVSITAPKPANRNPNITVNISAKCSSNKIILPTMDVNYKLSSEPATAYRLLGHVEKGVITTNSLKLNTSYDFSTTYSNQFVEVKNESTSITTISAIADIKNNTACN